MHFIYHASRIINFLLKDCSYQSKKSWIEWRNLVEDIYEFDFDGSKIKYYINQGKSDPYLDSKTLKDDLLNLERKNLIHVCELITLFHQVEQIKGEILAQEVTKQKWDDISSVFQLNSSEISAINNHVEEWILCYKKNKFHTEIRTPSSLIPITIDYFLRWIVLWLFVSKKVNFDVEALIILNIIVISPLLLIFSIIRDIWVKKRASHVFNTLKINKVKLKSTYNPWKYLILSFFVLTGIFIASRIFDIYDEEMPFFIWIIVCVLYATYLLIIHKYFSKKYPDFQEVVNQINSSNKINTRFDLNNQENDEAIVDMEVKLRSSNEKMEAFVLEAALFGALAFSGFLQIISSDYFSFSNMSGFTTTTVAIFDKIILFDLSNTSQLFSVFLSKEGLLSFMCYQSLFCSIFFLAVIASRLKYNDLTDTVDRALRLSYVFNAKEENYINNQKLGEDDEKVKSVNAQINNQLRIGYFNQIDIQPIMEYMKFFRTLGITTFFIIIITGGLFISVQLSLILLFISLLALSYFQFGKVSYLLTNINISVQEFYFKANKYVHSICWILIGLALILRTFSIPGGAVVMVLGFSILFIHYLLSLFVPEEIDDNLIAKNSIKFSGNFDIFLQKIFKFSLGLFFLGNLFKTIHWPGGGVLLILGLILMSLFFLFVKKTAGEKKWLGWFMSFTLSLSFVSLMFKLQHWEGASMLYYAATSLIIILSVLTYYHRNLFRPMLKKTVFLVLFFSLIMRIDIVAFGILHLNFNKNAVQIFKKESYFRQVLHSTKYSNLQTGRDSLKNELNEMTTYLLYESPTRFDANYLNEFSWEIYSYYNDSLILNEALIWCGKSIEIKPSYENLDTYASLLFKLKRFEEAEQYAVKAIEDGKKNNQNIQETITLLDKIRASMNDSN
jgi:hypothetical protein